MYYNSIHFSLHWELKRINKHSISTFSMFSYILSLTEKKIHIWKITVVRLLYISTYTSSNEIFIMVHVIHIYIYIIYIIYICYTCTFWIPPHPNRTLSVNPNRCASSSLVIKLHKVLSQTYLYRKPTPVC